jgi:hypothetical protein
MQGRVVRKAKRRLHEDDRKNIFAGFTGFSAAAVNPEQAFRWQRFHTCFFVLGILILVLKLYYPPPRALQNMYFPSS